MSKLADLRERQRAAVRDGRCGCLCGQSLPPRRHARRSYLNERHRDRAYVARLDARAADLGVPTRGRRIGLSELEARNPSRNRRDDAEKPRQRREARRREGVSIYLPSVPVATAAREQIALGLVDADTTPEMDATLAAFDRALARRRAREKPHNEEVA